MSKEIINKITTTFEEKYKRNDYHVFFSPGRVNLIGEHIDYNGGHVFPASITLGTYGVISKREDQQVNCYSLNFESLGIISFELDNLQYKEIDTWVNYVKGVIKYLIKDEEFIDSGFDILVYGNIPNGAGLSSSASLEMLVGYALNDLYYGPYERKDLPAIGQRVENKFMGVNSGIMDQFAVVMGEEDKAIFLDVNTMTYELVPAKFGDYKILILNTNKRRELADSKYNQRRSECESALEKLQEELPINELCELKPDSFEEVRHLIDDSVLEARAKHVIYENERTIQAKSLLEQGELEAFGKLLNASHQSLKEDYDVTGVELDTLVETAWLQEGVLGARMTGAGMGGCAIALVHEDHIESVKEVIQAEYVKTVGYEAGFFVAEIGQGVHRIQ